MVTFGVCAAPRRFQCCTGEVVFLHSILLMQLIFFRIGIAAQSIPECLCLCVCCELDFMEIVRVGWK